MPYDVRISARAESQIAKFERATQAAVRKKLLLLRENPRPHNAIKLKGVVNQYRLRVGDFRIV